MRFLVLVLFAFLPACAGPPQRCDILIHGGTVVDGTGAVGRRADVAIVGDRIVFVGSIPSTIEATRRIDAANKVVTPGFIDPHAHGDPRRTPGFSNFTAMGVTTICLGMDGSSPAADLPSWMERIDKGRLGVNIAPFVGHGTVRAVARDAYLQRVSRKYLATGELEKMAEVVERAMSAGAFGLSTGLEYDAGRFASDQELTGFARPVARHGGVVMSHVRSEDDGKVEASIDELIRQCASAGCRAHVSHMKIVYGKGKARAERLLRHLDRASIPITADVYPYVASYTTIGLVFPTWARPPNDYAEVRRTRREELAAFIREKVQSRNGPEATLFGSGPYKGKTLAAAAQANNMSFADLLIELGPRGASAAYFVMDAEVMRTLLADPRVVVSSDGSPTMRHPRGHGAFARVIRDFVVERKQLRLEVAIHKMTGKTAAIVGLRDRGVLRAGAFADVLVFDPAQVRDRATFARPYQRATGFDIVLVNGADPSARQGRLLRHDECAARVTGQ